MERQIINDILPPVGNKCRFGPAKQLVSTPLSQKNNVILKILGQIIKEVK
jgi:hypothetical protein